MGRGLGLLLVLLLVASSLSCLVSGLRPITAKTVWFTECDNTVETRDNVTDSNGVLCSREKMNYETGCCDAFGGQAGDCSRCKANECCDRYEHCVSCCMGSDKTEGYMKNPETFKVVRHPETGRFDTKWDYCTGQCRTTPMSTIFENMYKDLFHYCYGQYPMPQQTVVQLPREVKVTLGLRGQSCKATCESSGMRCAPQYFEAINLCEIVTEHLQFKCKYCKIGRSGPAANSGGPVVQSIANAGQLFDGICYQEKKIQNFDCDTEVTEAFNRVCPCT
ncbi:hypothetical protein HOP50_07g50240 [Chloropicon primus]|uniref:SREBP regulating gene protein n=1 Tax=Chloropicon primus TaxID=1764295 RepID=A0A5B8MQ48_9CHLO|nr:hypothetical protein A3770_07p49990 [Chloropicon primus]UPR01702.1 hypothetical protein HOP50_07g50240 [Chloropicon primus]|eukprot:QDZ22481.1 hypothetical protein A3770_07p49990 [Chloropicon primus]